MLFNSYVYIFLFLPVVFAGYFLLIGRRQVVAAKTGLVLASLFFYSWWNINYLPILIFSLVFNFMLGSIIQSGRAPRERKYAMVFGVIVNLIVLGYFKYADFFIDNVNSLLGHSIGSLDLLLPLAISFFTFQQIAYLSDCYKNQVSEYDFLNYSLFVTFFPQLIAGPIVHHKEMMPQFMNNRWNLRIKYTNIAAGLFIFTLGLFKKVVIADTFSVVATNGFDNAATLNIVEAWVTSLSYTFQLYFDFSGYTDMAIGSALLFNIKLPVNFDSPYKALNIRDFWLRWHITLSRFLRDYVYIPLGGNRLGRLITYRNLIITFLLGGIWHGAGWTFIAWGALHGIALVLHRIWADVGYRLNKYIAWFVTFNFINITWVLFRAKDFVAAKKIIVSMFCGDLVLDYHWKEFMPKSSFYEINYGPWLQNIYAENRIFIYLLLSMVIVVVSKNSNTLVSSMRASKKTALMMSMLFAYAALSLNRASEFLYFNF